MKFLIIILLTYPLSAIAFNHAKDEIRIKSVNGLYTYDSDFLTGSSSSFLNPSIEYSKNILDNTYVGITYELHFNYQSQITSLNAFGVSTRYSVYRDSNFTFIESDFLSFIILPRYEFFAILNVKKYNYFLGKNNIENTEFEQSGSYYNIDFGISSSYQFTKKFKSFMEITTTLIAFSSTDDRVRLKSNTFSFGLSMNI